jgi:hypothetical protein
MASHRRIRSATAGAVLALTLPLVLGQASARDNIGPGFVSEPVLHAYYDGIDNDLRTGGLGATGLANTVPPPFADALNPTAWSCVPARSTPTTAPSPT